MQAGAVRLPWTFGSGHAVGGLFGGVYALLSAVAWVSLGTQVHVLVGSQGLLPARDLVEALRVHDAASFLRFPTLFLWTQSDWALTAGVVVGVLLALASLVVPSNARRVCLALSTALYLSYVMVCRLFLSFQWDNLLLECGLLVAFLPSNRPAPLVHFLFRMLLFKLYFESGLAKWQSPIRDWQDGSAMTFYYETAPLPTFLAWYAHNLPVWWHHIESWAALAMELVLPFGIFGPRRVRLGVAVALTLFQVVNAATANYGFFCFLAVALHLFLLDDADVERVWRRIRPPRSERAPASAPGPVATWAGRTGAAVYLLVSLVLGLFTFTEPGVVLGKLIGIARVCQTYRFVNTYHLFASITRERIEPELQTLADGGAADIHAADDAAWTPRHLWHKPGDVQRAPDFVAPHQPRVDFQLWFHGLAFRRREPAYLSMLVERMCEDAPAVQRLFRDPLPPHPRAVRVVYWQYHFTTRAQARATGAWWRRERVGATGPIPCPRAEPR